MTATVTVIQPSGIFDNTRANQLRREISDLLQSEVPTILVDLKDVTFMDSSGLGALVAMLKSVRSAGGQFFICSVNDQVKMLFKLTSMDQVFRPYANQEEFHQARQSN